MLIFLNFWRNFVIFKNFTNFYWISERVSNKLENKLEERSSNFERKNVEKLIIRSNLIATDQTALN